MKLYTNELDGKKIAYSSETEFLVQTSKTKNGKSGYETRYTIKGNLAQAVMYYNMINIGYGYRKRLLMPSSKKPVLARQAS
jgi:hypothetical protein